MSVPSSGVSVLAPGEVEVVHVGRQLGRTQVQKHVSSHMPRLALFASLVEVGEREGDETVVLGADRPHQHMAGAVHHRTADQVLATEHELDLCEVRLAAIQDSVQLSGVIPGPRILDLPVGDRDLWGDDAVEGFTGLDRRVRHVLDSKCFA